MLQFERKEDRRKKYHVLIIWEEAGGGGYRKVGARNVETQYLSINCVARTLW